MAVGTTTKPLVEPIRLVVGDERRLIAEALAALIGNMAGFTVKDLVVGAGALTVIVAEQPELVLIGVGTGSVAGLDLARSIRDRGLEVEIVLVADVLEPELVSFVLDQQLSGLLLSDLPAFDVAACLAQIAHGHAVMPVGWQAMLADDGSDSLALLTERQMQVLTLLAAGCSYEEIGRQLFITVNTVKFHAREIFLRLGVSNRMAAARFLVERKAPIAGQRLSA